MKTMTMTQPRKTALLAGVAALALIFGAPVGHFAAGDLVGSGKAFAQSDSGHGGGQGGRGQGGQGYQGGRAGTGATGGSAGQGQGGPSDDSDAKGPQYKGGSGGSQGGKPVWAQEGIPEVELGRLNVVRSPDTVIARALAEVLANFDPTKSAALYSLTAVEFAAYVKANFDTVVRIDSPLENLALYKDLLTNWPNSTTQLPQVTNTTANLAAIFLGSAADKTIPITKDTVIAVTKILGLEISELAVIRIAALSEIVRQAIAEAHG